MSAVALRATDDHKVAGRDGPLPRLWAAVAVVVALHAALLLVRPGGSPASAVVAAASVMAIRVVPSPSTPTVDVAATLAPPIPSAVQLLSTPAAPAISSMTKEPRPVERSASAVRDTRVTAPAGAPPHSIATPAPAPVAGPEPVAATPATAPPAEKALPAAPDYAFGIRLDPGPRPLDDITPDYPEAGHLREGSVVLRLLISATGHVDNVAVVRSEPRGVFDEAALEAFGKARFAPGLAAGTPVKSQITVEVQFAPINRGGRVSGRTY